MDCMLQALSVVRGRAGRPEFWAAPPPTALQPAMLAIPNATASSVRNDLKHKLPRTLHFADIRPWGDCEPAGPPPRPWAS
jgi:hypothetical protein